MPGESSSSPEPRQSWPAPGRGQVSGREWRWVLGWTLLVLLLTSIPYLIGWRLALADGTTFGGFVIGVEDGNSYLAKMGQGARGHWLFHIVYTSEPHEGALFFLFHLLLGKVAAAVAVGWPASALPLVMIWIYHLARLVCGAGLLAVVYRFAAEFLPEINLRRVAWLMVALGGGLGWLLLAFGLDDWLGSYPLDFILPEGFSFLVLSTLPHIALGRALLLAGMLAWLKASRPGLGLADRAARWKAALLAGGCWLVMGLVVPFYPLVAGSVVGATLLAFWLVERRPPVQALRVSLVAGSMTAPVVLYSAWVFVTNPVMKGWSAQNLILSPPPGHYLAAYAAPALLAVPGAVWAWRQRPAASYWLLVAWLLVVPPLLYAPFNLQRRLLEGYQLPLYVLAALGVGRVLWQPGRRWGRFVTGLALMLMVPTALILVGGSALVVQSMDRPIYHPPGQMALAEWLVQNVDEGALVLAGHDTGNFLPAWAPVRTYLGHGPETIDFAAKAGQVGRFFRAETDDGWRQALLTDNGVGYVVHGPDERALGAFDPGASGYLDLVLARDGWALYQVTSDGGQGGE